MADSSLWLERRVIAYAHQGGAWESPSSTLHAIDHALEVGATGIELEVHATAALGLAHQARPVGRLLLPSSRWPTRRCGSSAG